MHWARKRRAAREAPVGNDCQSGHLRQNHDQIHPSGHGRKRSYHESAVALACSWWKSCNPSPPPACPAGAVALNASHSGFRPGRSIPIFNRIIILMEQRHVAPRALRVPIHASSCPVPPVSRLAGLLAENIKPFFAVHVPCSAQGMKTAGPWQEPDTAPGEFSLWPIPRARRLKTDRHGPCARDHS